MQDDRAYLLDMLLEARRVLRFADRLTRDEFENNEQTVYATVKAVENIGEAAKRVSRAVQSAHPEIPWSKIIGMRNRLVHDYRVINFDVLWLVIQVEAPNLIASLEPLVPPEGEI